MKYLVDTMRSAEREGFHRGDWWATKCLVNGDAGRWTGSNPGSNADAIGREPNPGEGEPHARVV